ncbi:MAG: DUF22 domain-containing protein [Methanobacterium sp.]
MVRIITRLDDIKREHDEIEAHSLGDFKVGTIIGKLRAIIAHEDVRFKASQTKPVMIKKIAIPPNHIIFVAAYATNKFGHAIAVGEDVPLPMSMEKKVDHALFAAGIDGDIKRDDLLGVLVLLPVEMLK